MSLKEKNAERWKNLRISSANGPEFETVAKTLLKYKTRYQDVAKTLAKQGHEIPWEFIAVTHYREAGFGRDGQPRFDRYLGNGQVLSRRTTIVPIGRGPFKTWEDGAVDALVYAPPYAAKNTDWSIGGTLAKLEEYNGLGYAQMGKPSPYLWAKTNQYVSGKYVADHVYDPNHVDKQLGVAGLLKFMGWKNDKISGPATAVVAGGSTLAVMWDHVVAHPYLSGIVIALGAGLVWWVVHTIRNRK